MNLLPNIVARVVVLVLLVCHFPVVLFVVGLDLSDGCGIGGDCVNVFADL